MKEDKPPRKKVSTRRPNPEDTRGRESGDKVAPAAAERTDDPGNVKAESPAPGADRDVRRPPVTNQDEQEKITNASDSDLPIEE